MYVYKGCVVKNRYRVLVHADDGLTSEMLVDARTPYDAAGAAVKYERKRIKHEGTLVTRVEVHGGGMKHVDRKASLFDKQHYDGEVVR
jgi:hypothetical protein